MAAINSTESVKQITYLAAALKAPRITNAAARLADQARDSGWSFEDYLAAVLEREVSARNASGAELRIKAAGSRARKTLENFDWDAQPAVRQQIAALASGGLLLEGQNAFYSALPGPGKHISRPRSGSSPPDTGTASSSRPRPTGSPASPTPTGKATSPKSSPGCVVTG